MRRVSPVRLNKEALTEIGIEGDHTQPISMLHTVCCIVSAGLGNRRLRDPLILLP